MYEKENTEIKSGTKETELQYAAKSLDSQINNLHNTISILYERLSLIMTDPYPIPSDQNKTDRDVTSPLAKGIVESSRQIMDASARLSEILNRLAV